MCSIPLPQSSTLEILVVELALLVSCGILVLLVFRNLEEREWNSQSRLGYAYNTYYTVTTYQVIHVALCFSELEEEEIEQSGDVWIHIQYKLTGLPPSRPSLPLCTNGGRPCDGT